MKGQHTIINEMVQNAAEVMKNKVKFNEAIIEHLEGHLQLDTDGVKATIKKLKASNKKTCTAVRHIEKNAGCWA